MLHCTPESFQLTRCLLLSFLLPALEPIACLVIMAHLSNGRSQDLLNNLVNNIPFRQQHGMTQRAVYRQNDTQIKVQNFLAYMQAQNPPPQNVHVLAWWNARYPNDAIGGMLSNYLHWLSFFNADTIGCETLFTHYLRSAQEELNLVFPGLNAGTYEHKTLSRNSVNFRVSDKFIKNVHCGKKNDTGEIKCLTPVDADRLLVGLAPEPHNYRMAAYVLGSLEIGTRMGSFMDMIPTSGVRRQDGLWRITYRGVKNDRQRTDNVRIIPAAASAYMTKFNSSKDMADFVQPNNFFCWPNLQAANKCLSHQFMQVGYPVRYFGTKSLRSGFVTTSIVNKVLNGMDKEDAITQVNSAGGWAVGNESIKPYIDQHIVALAVNHQNDPNYTSIRDFSIVELHPDLEDIAGYLVPHPNTGVLELPGPWRATRYCANSGTTPALLEELDNIWTQVRTPGHDPVVMNPNWAVNTRFLRIGERLFGHQGINVPVQWFNAATLLCNTWENDPNGPRDFQYAAGTLVNILVRNRILTANRCANNTLQNMPLDMYNNFELFQKPPEPHYIAPPKPLREVNVSSTTSLASLRLNALGRTNARAVLIVYACGERHRVVEISNAQAVLFDNTNGRPTEAAWLAAAQIPDP